MTRHQFRQSRAEALRSRRLSLGVTQADVAALLLVDESLVSRWESGEREIGFYEWTRIDEYFTGHVRAQARRPDEVTHAER